MVFGVPLMCMTTAVAPALPTVPAISGSNPKPLISLTIEAPAARAREATADLYVSIEIGTDTCRTSASITGRTRSSSS